MRQGSLVIAVLGLLAVKCSGDQGMMNKPFGDVSLLGAKAGFHSHLQRMLQSDIGLEVQAGTKQVCSPAARQDGACISPDPEIPLPEPVKPKSPRARSCSGPDCVAEPRKANDKADSQSDAAAPLSKTMSYGPMTHDAYDRMVQRKRAALKAKLAEAGELTVELNAFLSGAERVAVDASDIPLPEPLSTSSSSKLNSDFEMRFEPQTPSPDPRMKVQRVAESPAPAPTTTTTTTAAAAAKPELIAESPAPEPTLTSSAATTTTTTTSQTTASVVNGPARPPMTEQEAARIAAQQAAREASLARKREYVQEQQAAQRKKVPQSPASAPTVSVSAQAQQAKLKAAASMQQSSARNAQKSSAAASVSSAAVVPKAVVSAASTRWDTLDYVCAVSLVVAIAVAVFVAIAVLEDLTSQRRIGRIEGSPLVFHWFALTRGLFRRCRRAFFLAMKHLTGHASELPVSANENGAMAPLLRFLAPVITFARVFWTALHASQSGRSRASSSGGGSFDAAPVGYDSNAMATATAELQLRRRH